MTQHRANTEPTRAKQWQASDPKASAWVAANAGSGKTYVLTQRVLRLLFQGVQPSKILCLTFTKAAAANMSIKVFSTLSEWTHLDDVKLEAAIRTIGVEEHLTPERLAFARRLFARTVETPGGLKIQTIHAFCERILHLFPFEAGVAARFTVMEDQEQTELLGNAREHALNHAATDPTRTAYLECLARNTNSDDFLKLIKEALNERDAIEALIQDRGVIGYGKYLAGQLDLPPDATPDSLRADLIGGGIPQSEWLAVADAMNEGGSNDSKRANELRLAVRASDDDQRIRNYFEVFFTKEGKPRGGTQKIISKPLQKLHPHLLGILEDEQKRLILLRDHICAAELVERTIALFAIVETILNQYRQDKIRRGKLDFDDLIERTLTLLSRSDASAWVLYKLDAGIDHILIDEAQDTSPEQWQILSQISEDFMSGEGQRGVLRTFFAVGDDKQSIYSFQGAKPEMFDEKRVFFQRRTENAQQDFKNVSLTMSFRSAAGILACVNAIFNLESNRQNLSSDQAAPVHEAWKADVPSVVELWPSIEPTQAEQDGRDWKLPLDATDAQEPAAVLAQRIARMIATWLRPDSQERVHDDRLGQRPIRAGDIMILVRKRGALFNAVIRALKENFVPVAGADRLQLTDHLAVMDLITLGRALLLPDDDLSLACVLKSPLFNLNDDDLLALAPKRELAPLADQLSLSSDPRHQNAHARLSAWRELVKQTSPFQFYAHVLSADHGRRDFIARLGPEAGDALDEFLRLALSHERDHVASLATFLADIEGADISIKRDMEAAGDSVRVMTVHAAKGLEAKIVLLPDTCSKPSRHGSQRTNLLSWPTPGGDILFWSKSSKDPEVLSDARVGDDEVDLAEHRRLLYVALTRAEERLYIMGAGMPQAGCWHEMIQTALQPMMSDVAAPWSADENVLRYADQSFEQASAAAFEEPVTAQYTKPVWLDQPAHFERMPDLPISPSSALAAADQFDAPAQKSDLAKERAIYGSHMHALLQHLPNVASEKRRALGQMFVDARAQNLSKDQRISLLNEALGVLEDPAVAEIFAHPARAEVSIAGRVALPNGRFVDIVGQIDLIVETPDEIVIVDFKTGTSKSLADTPEPYAAQLALYGATLAALYPKHTIRALLIWTAKPTIVELPPARLEKALAAINP